MALSEVEELEMLRLRKQKALTGGSSPTHSTSEQLDAGMAGLEKIQPSIKPPQDPINPPGRPNIGQIVPRMREGMSNLLEYADTVGRALEGMGPAEMLGQVPRAIESGFTVVPKIVGVAGKALKGVGAKVGTAYDDLRGVAVPGAKAEAAAAAKSAISSGITSEDARLKALGSVREKLDKHLESFRAPNAKNTLDVQGTTVRDAYSGAMDSAKAARAEAADVQFSHARDVAAQKEAAGARIDTAAIEAGVTNLMKQAEGIPGLENGLKNILGAVKGAPPAAPTAPGIWLTPGVAPSVPPATKGKTFEQLEFARRYLNDVAFSADLEGFPAILRRQARDVAVKLDEAMQAFVPEFKTYKDNYEKLSEPLESLGTRFGKALSSTEGGMSENAYNKVADADLPNRLFAKKDGVELMIDALSGGKSGDKAARAEATKQVNHMVENWIVETTRAKGPAGALARIAAPEMQGTLSAVPEVAAKLGTKFGQAAGVERAAGQVGKTISSLGERGAKMKTDLDMAEAMGDTADAYNAYVKSLNTGRRAGIIPKQQYDAAIKLVERANTLEEKTATIQRLMKRIVYGGALIGTGAEVRNILK